MNEVRRLAAEEAILNEVTSFVRRDSAGSQDTQTQDDVVEGLVQQYARLVYRICHAALRNHQDAEDATQETFLRVFRYNSKLAAVKEPKPWLARIAWRVAIDHGKRRGRAKEVSLDDPEKWPGDLPSRAVS